MNESSNLDSCVIELHYCFRDDVHYMDELIYNRCKREFYVVVREVARGLGVKVKIRTEELIGDGSLCCLMIDSPEFWSVAEIVVKIVDMILQTPIGGEIVGIIQGGLDLIGKGIEKQRWKIEKEIEEEKRDIAKIKCETAKIESETAKSKYETAEYDRMTKELYEKSGKKIEKRRSNFFANLFLCGDVEELNIRFTDANGVEFLPEKRIKRDDFGEFIMPNNEVVPEYVNDAIIEIIPPIDIESRHKWMGRYNGYPILPLTIMDYDFKKSVHTGQIRIEDIVSIRCNLEIRRKIDKECGEAVPKGYKVVDVVEFWY